MREITVLVVIPTQSGMRICADYRRTANPQLEPLKYPMKTANQLLPGIWGKRLASLSRMGT